MSDPQVLGGRYELAEEIGHGGMGQVYRGRDLRLGRTVAVKSLRTDLARDPSFLGRFKREAQSAAALNHPAIVAVYDTGDDGDARAPAPYIVMEHVSGATVRELLDEGPMEPDRAVKIIIDVCRALDYSHRAGIIHRDIKPGNVMITDSGEVKVMDFGIARAVTEGSATMTQTAAVIGTAQYLSPEQARGEVVDGRSDIYSTGCLLYEMVTGTPPFTGDSPVAVAYQHVRENPDVPSSRNGDVTPALDSVLMMALAKNPDNRYATAGDLAEDLARVVAGQRVVAPPVLAPLGYDATVTTVVPRTGGGERPSRFRSGRVAAYVVLALAVVTVFVVAALLASRAFTGSADLTAPNLIGKTKAAAIAEIQRQGLTMGDTTQRFSNQPIDDVVYQSPVQGVSINSTTPINLVVSKGAETVDVPALTNLTLQQATQTLTDRKLVVGTVRQQDVNRPAGTVLSSDPAAGGSPVAVGTKVDLVVASGQVQVPDVRNQPLNDAQLKLRDLGFDVRTEQVQSAGAEAGTVVGQSPSGGRADLGTTVTLTVAATPSPTTAPPPRPTMRPTPSAAPTSAAPSTPPAPSASPTPSAGGSPSTSASPAA